MAIAIHSFVRLTPVTTELRHMNGRKLVVAFSAECITAAFNKYDAGAMIQEAFSFLNAEEREFMMTGMTVDEQHAIFGTTEDN